MLLEMIVLNWWCDNDLPNAAIPEAEDAIPAAVGKLFVDSMENFKESW